ncbi:MAG: hypothetical protein ACI81T_002656 [Bacteroidia bacterium]|jgi:hypothetical protein
MYSINLKSKMIGQITQYLSIQMKYSFSLILLCILLFSASNLNAQDADSTSFQIEENSAVKYDSSKIELRTFDESALNEIRESGDFTYMEVKQVETYSLWDRFWVWLYKWYSKIFSDPTYSTTFKTVMYILCGAIIIYVVLKLAGIDARGVFYGKSAKKKIQSDILEEDIHEIDFNTRIAQAVESQNFREAIRLHYLKNLKILSDQNLIDWKINKTNHDYEVEIRDDSIKTPFSRITYLYDNICYGDYPIDSESYSRFVEDFEVFDKV